MKEARMSYPSAEVAGSGAAGAAEVSISGFLKLSAFVDEATVFMCGVRPASLNSWPVLIGQRARIRHC